MSTTTMLRAALPAIPGVNLIPGVRKSPEQSFDGLTLSTEGFTADPEHVAAYAAICGFPTKDTMPLVYPHMPAFDLHLKLMANPAFPYPVIGLVHIENIIRSHRPIDIDETLDISVSVGASRPHRVGKVMDFETTVTAGDEIVWESTSSYLRRGAKHEDAPRGLALPKAPEATTTWELPADLGRRYGAISGDLNPIHLHPLTAKPFGFPRHIAHGMWTKARCLGAIENRLPDAVEIQVAFKTPVLLPGSVGFGLDQTADGLAFGLSNPKDGAPHLTGLTRAL